MARGTRLPIIQFKKYARVHVKLSPLEYGHFCLTVAAHPVPSGQVTRNRPVSYSNGWTGSSMKWRLMRAN